MEAFVAVLISQPLRLNRLFIGPDFFKESRIVGSVLRSALIETIDYGLRPDFGHLETVSLERYDDFYHRTNIRDPADVLPVFYLSSVKRISASIDNPVTFSWPAKHPPSCASLRSLKLTFIREPFLPQLLSVANQLESFEWEWYYSPHFVGDVHTPVIDLTQLNAALSYARNTLTELVVSAVSESDGVDFPPLRIQGSFEWISRFGKLRKFTVPLTVLMGFSADMTRRIDEFLPRSLEFLTITDDLCLQMDYTWEDHEIFSVLESWLEHFHTSTPRLRGIALPLTAVTDWEWNQTTKDDLRALGAKVGIEVEITKIE
ncbi:hypothetical protein NKR23_g1148 [Pleurostoma richardsiae]|uniref:Uncharacterized protein n=1 Tax=Pleurostoma richardsiae TaxID=41990 RepID=A0AA38RRM0_9PEZI|nr:hypothetical protein NKR23_g1148 [Pleurostoma richardsiae]